MYSSLLLHVPRDTAKDGLMSRTAKGKKATPFRKHLYSEGEWSMTPYMVVLLRDHDHIAFHKRHVRSDRTASPP